MPGLICLLADSLKNFDANILKVIQCSCTLKSANKVITILLQNQLISGNLQNMTNKKENVLMMKKLLKPLQ